MFIDYFPSQLEKGFVQARLSDLKLSGMDAYGDSARTCVKVIAG
jgi:hypothetical protein